MCPGRVFSCWGLRTTSGMSEPRDALSPRMIAMPKPIPSKVKPTPVSVAPIPQHRPKPAMRKSVPAEVIEYTVAV